MRQTGTVNDTTCTNAIDLDNGDDLRIMIEGSQIFAFQESFADQHWIFYGFSPE